MSKIKFGLVPPMPGADCDGLIDFSIKADKLNFDLKKETLDISMFDNQQIDVKLKNQ